MLHIGKPNVMWAWVCPVTGIVFDDGWGTTEAYATGKTERYWGKRRMATGDMRAVRVTIEALTAEETEAERAKFARWKADSHALHVVATTTPNANITGR